MRLLFLAHSHPELQAGGTEIFARDLFRTLRQNGHSGLFVAGATAYQRSASPGTPFQTVGDCADELLAWTGAFDIFALSQIDLHGLSRPFADLINDQQPDVVHIHHLLNIGVELVGVVRRCAPSAKIIMTLHDYYPMCANDGQLMTTTGMLCSGAKIDNCKKCFPERSLTDFKLRELHIRRALDQVDHFISPSIFLKEKYIAWGIPERSISVIPNGLPTVEPAAVRNTQRRDRFAFFGHINGFKGAAVAAEASSILSRQNCSHQLSIFGGTEFQSEQIRLQFAAACAVAPATNYRGPYRRSEFKRLIEWADWVVFPSLWWENAPLVIGEAQQHNRPVICSDIGGPLELVQNGVNGLHFRTGDCSALADTMRQAIEERGLWQRLVDGINEPVSIQASARIHQECYLRIIESSLLQVAA